jgi:Holliday junction resolvase
VSTESNLQATIRKHLKDKGCYVLKTRPDARGGAPTGCPDIIFMLEGFWGAIEVKATPQAPYRTLQKETLEKLDAWSFARRVDPTNWPAVREELDKIL